ATTIRVNWAKIGLGAIASVGTTTPADEENRKKLLSFVKEECRVLEAFSALGSHDYILRVIDRDITTLRNKIITPLEPLTSGIDTSVVVERIKNPDYRNLLEYVKREVGHSNRDVHTKKKSQPSVRKKRTAQHHTDAL
ncbi:MAG TPA: hypothetical protein VLV18_08220, partial [Terriglobales bacterium]|nr:hypothetical protein [Terriglobales bacterium]